MRIRIFNVGRMKKSAEITVADEALPDEVAEAMYRAVMKMSALGSRGIDCEWNADEKRGVVVVGGFRIVGHAEVVQP